MYFSLKEVLLLLVTSFATKINRRDFVTDTQCAYSAVRTDSINIIQIKFLLQKFNSEKYYLCATQ